MLQFHLVLLGFPLAAESAGDRAKARMLHDKMMKTFIIFILKKIYAAICARQFTSFVIAQQNESGSQREIIWRGSDTAWMTLPRRERALLSLR
jgi:hypothetical protein